ncbi:serine hydrolase domain-containing protein [Naasia lichenicola]|uniref:serine hydrolase domain-containing protein n=1 Tax=Naasia lichenicola TaxID=2565933 RepID=UPI00130DFB0F|nr:serine hydrolase domain-containing protein [Naasia lichenicola]
MTTTGPDSPSSSPGAETDAPPSTALPSSTRTAESVAARGIGAFLDALEAHPDIEPHSLMLLRHGRVIAQGWWAPFTPSRLHHVYSVSKTFTVSALGFAVDEGLVGLDDTVISHFPEFADEITTPRSRAIRIRDLAAMAAGHREDMYAPALETDPLEPVRGFLLHEPDEEPGSVFAYSQPCTYTIAAIIQRASGQTLTDYLRPRMFDPLGIGAAVWREYPAGRQVGFAGLHVTTEAIAKLGLLHLQDGVWEGEQVLPVGWAAEVRQRRVSTGADESDDWEQGYGFQVWQARHGYRGDGASGQFCVILPEQDVVLAVTAGTYAMRAMLEAAWEHLLPAVDAPTSDADDATLETRLGALALPSLEGAAAPAEADGWAGSFYLTGAEDARLRTASVAEDDGAWRIELTDVAGKTLRVPVLGTGWTTIEAVDGLPPVAVTGGWVDDELLRIDISFLETPHRITLSLRRESRRAVARWLTEPLLVAPDDAGIFGLQAPR